MGSGASSEAIQASSAIQSSSEAEIQAALSRLSGEAHAKLSQAVESMDKGGGASSDLASVQVVVTSLAGQTCVIAAQGLWRVNDLKGHIERDLQVPYIEQRLLLGSAQLDGTELLSSLRPDAEGDALHVTVVRLCEGRSEWLHRLRVSPHYSTFRSAPEHIQQSRDLVYAAVCACPEVLDYAPEKFRHDPVIVTAAITKQPYVFQELPEEMRADRQVALRAVRGDGRNLEFAAREFHRDAEFVDVAVSTHPPALLLSPKELWEPDLVLKAVSISEKHRSPALLRSFLRNPQLQAVFKQRDFMLALVQKDPLSLRLASGDLQADRELATLAIERNPSALEFASEGLKADREFVMFAVEQKPRALEYACKDLRDDDKLVKFVVDRDHEGLKYASHRLKGDPVIVATACQTQFRQGNFSHWSSDLLSARCC